MTPRLRVILAEDESLARDRLRRFLRADQSLHLVGEAVDGPAAVRLILEHRPHIALLDVRLPGLTGFEVLSHLGDQTPPAVIFVSAFERHALHAFDSQAVDYLLKPFSAERFRVALQRARLRCAARAMPLPADVAPAGDGERMVLKCGLRRVVVPLHDIHCATAANTRCEVVTATSTMMVNESLKSLEGRLPKNRFARISRFALVNLAHVIALEPKSHGDQFLLLRNRQRLTVARTLREEVVALLKRGC